MNPHVTIKFLRKDHLIVDASNGDVVFEGKQRDGTVSINAAKRRSRELQAEHGAFTVKVVDRLIPVNQGGNS